jgi:hypothetical protein
MKAIPDRVALAPCPGLTKFLLEPMPSRTSVPTVSFWQAHACVSGYLAAPEDRRHAGPAVVRGASTLRRRRPKRVDSAPALTSNHQTRLASCAIMSLSASAASDATAGLQPDNRNGAKPEELAATGPASKGRCPGPRASDTEAVFSELAVPARPLVWNRIGKALPHDGWISQPGMGTASPCPS